MFLISNKKPETVLDYPTVDDVIEYLANSELCLVQKEKAAYGVLTELNGRVTRIDESDAAIFIVNDDEDKSIILSKE